MDLFNENRRRVNLGGSNRSSDSTSSSSSAASSRAEVLEKARKEREQRQKAKEREVAASKIQAFYRSRHSHQLLSNSRRKQWDVDLAELARAAQAGGKGITASALSNCIASYFFFSVLTPRRTPKLLPSRSSASRSQLLQSDLTRFRHLVKLLLASYRQPNKEQHIGSMIIESVTGSRSSSVVSSPLSASASRWLFQMSRISALILEHIGSVSVASNSIEHVQNEIVLLWLILDVNQWPFVKDATQSTPEQKSLIQQVQLQLATRLTQRNPLDAKLASTLITAAPHSSASSAVRSSKSVPSYQTRPSIDLLSCLRARILDLTHLPKDGVATPAQLAQKTSVALLMATVIRVMTLYSFNPSPSVDHPLPTAFVYHILSIPLLPQRLKFMGLQALLPSLLATTVFDRSLESLTFHVRALNQLGISSSSSGTAFTFPSVHSSGSSIAFAFNRQNFHSVSYSWFDEASIVKTITPTASVSASASAVGTTSSSMSDDDISSPPRLYTYFTRGDSEEEDSAAKKKPKTLSGLAWIMGNLLELVTLLDETKSEAASQSFSHFLAAIEQLIQAIPHAELPALAGEGGTSSTLADHDNATNQMQRMPPAFTKQFAVFGERSFLDRLSRRLMTDPNHASNMEDVSSPAALNDIPIVCVLIDSILFKWTQSSNSILNTLVFSSDIVSKLWKAIKASGIVQRIDAAGKGAITANFSAFPTAGSTSSASSSSSSSSGIITMDQVFHDRFFNLLPLFCTFFGHLLIVLDDEEFFVKQSPFSIQTDIVPMVHLLKTLLYHLYWVNFTTAGTPARLRERFSKLFIQLRDRQSRKQFMSAEQWLFNTPTQNIPIEQLQSELMSEEELRRDLEASASELQLEQGLISASRASSIMASIPFVLPFGDRVKLFYAHIAADKQRARMGGIQFDHGLGKRIRVRRATILEDSFEAMNGLSGTELKGRIQVEFVDEHGLNEAGVDGGGLWKEMLTTLLKKAFDPSYNLFSETQEHFIYPNPQALDLPLIPHEDGSMMSDTDDPSAGEESKQILSYFYFLGAMIGKALYDGIQIETQFALFFLRYCVGLSNYLDDLAGLDPMLYQSLMKIKSFPRDQDLSELGLTFSVDKQVFGVNKTIDLIPNGRNITVTHENKVRFLYFMSDYYLNRQMSRQANAFSQGLVSIINRDWLRMFAAEEMRLLISGSQGVNIRDLAQFTNYASGYSANHEAIKWFWEILSEFDHEQVAALLRFTTSCSRAPLLGFQHLYPGFCIQRVNVDVNEQTLPTAATCMNLLRLPRYSTKDRMKEKLLYAITTASHGFGLT